VESIKLAPRTAGHIPEKNRNIEVVLRIDRRFQQDILSDSTASLVTQGLLGNRVVNITRGFTGVPLKEGQEITGTEEKAIKEVVERSADVLLNLQALSDNAKDLLAGVQEGRGTLGKLLTDDQAYKNLNSVLAKTNQVVTSIQEGQGTLGRLVVSDELYGKANTAIDSVNVIMNDVRSQKGTIGKLLYDPSLYDEAKKALSGGNAVISDVREGKGTLGKLATDDALYNKLRDTSTNLASATAKLNDNTTTAGKLFSDPQLYDNLAGLSGDLRLLIGDFRQNPKKYLHFKVTVF
jgi:phospholipid/cholesterol/gamma-HCH transport system substrate-binding protein